MSLRAFRPSLRLGPRRPPQQQQRGAQQSQQQVKDYYNVSPGTAPPLDETELLHGTAGVDAQAVGLDNSEREEADNQLNPVSSLSRTFPQEMMEPNSNIYSVCILYVYATKHYMLSCCCYHDRYLICT